MKRDMDFVREILLKIEQSENIGTKELLNGETDKEALNKLAEHLDLLDTGANFISGVKTNQMGYKIWFNLKLTWNGHEYLDAVRDPEIWRLTKEGAAAAGGFSIDLIMALARGYIKTKIEKHTGIDLDI